MATTVIEQTRALLSSVDIAKAANGSPKERRDLKTVIWHADEVAYKKQLEPQGGKEDMWQGGDM